MTWQHPEITETEALSLLAQKRQIVEEEIKKARQRILILMKNPDKFLADLCQINQPNSPDEQVLRSGKRCLRALDRAQKRIERGNFGICIDCREPIPRERIIHNPQSSRCAHCKTLSKLSPAARKVIEWTTIKEDSQGLSELCKMFRININTLQFTT